MMGTILGLLFLLGVGYFIYSQVKKSRAKPPARTNPAPGWESGNDENDQDDPDYR